MAIMNVLSLLFASVLIAATSSIAQSTAGVQLNITGRLVCSINGNPILGILGRPLSSVNVSLSCDGRTVASAMTNSVGVFQITVNATNLNITNILGCRVIVPLPISADCKLLPSSGTLQAPITLTSILQGPLAAVLGFVTGIFQLVR